MCALSCSLFRTFACGSFRSWTISPLPQSVPRKNPNYICNTAAHGGKQALAQLSRPRIGCFAPPPENRVLCAPAQKSELHLQSFRDYITSRFENDPSQYIHDRLNDFDEDPNHYYIAERPKAYKRPGDSKIYNSTEIDIITTGIYRSLHYTIKYKGYYVEIQGRTLFEEGWSEIDHDIVYKEAEDDEMIRDYSGLLNRLSGLADEMSSYFRRLKQENTDRK